MKQNLATIMEMFADKSVQRRHQILSIECERLAVLPQFRREAFELLWKHGIYDPIDFYKSFEGQGEQDQAALKKFISKAVAQISQLLAQYQDADTQFALLLFLGDLFRYTFILCGKESRDFNVSGQCYQKALMANPRSGRPLNQLALLSKEVADEDQSLFLFLRSLAQEKDTAQAVKNVKMLGQSLTPEYRTLFNFTLVSLFNFSRFEFDSTRKEFDQLLEEVRTRDFVMAIKLVHMISMGAMFAFRNEASDEQFRYISTFLCQKLTAFLETCRSKICEAEDEEVQLSKRRRRRRDESSANSEDSDSSKEENDSDDEAENCNGQKDRKNQCENGEIWMLATTVAEFLANCAEHFAVRKLSVSLKLQYQNLVKLFVDLLNELLPSLVPLMSSSSSTTTPKALLLNWMLGKWFDANSKDNNGEPNGNERENNCGWPKVLAHYLRRCIDDRKVGLVFDKYFQLISTCGEKEAKQIVESISRLHLTHVNELNERSSRIPVYIAPTHFVFLDKLAIVERLVASTPQTIIVARSELSKLDKMKRENANARQAIRWIQNSIPTGRVRMLQHTNQNFVAECLHFLEEKKLLDKQTLFLSILTANDDEQEEFTAWREELAKHPAIDLENVGAFAERISRALSNG